ncbi:unnamed protein product [Cyprideis torosa]|uniref:Uncharacterized protein n=1 Tax=Cyprideis torosa TaxID=163714 RepID=A0A7R8WNQ4_9CRUS|nr:unnamed protein product [Cyprideis torosa]CAG0900917.1 unnamed protein product [Cyprideis torosa]
MGEEADPDRASCVEEDKMDLILSHDERESAPRGLSESAESAENKEKKKLLEHELSDVDTKKEDPFTQAVFEGLGTMGASRCSETTDEAVSEIIAKRKASISFAKNWLAARKLFPMTATEEEKDEVKEEASNVQEEDVKEENAFQQNDGFSFAKSWLAARKLFPVTATEEIKEQASNVQEEDVKQENVFQQNGGISFAKSWLAARKLLPVTATDEVKGEVKEQASNVQEEEIKEESAFQKADAVIPGEDDEWNNEALSVRPAEDEGDDSMRNSTDADEDAGLNGRPEADESNAELSGECDNNAELSEGSYTENQRNDGRDGDEESDDILKEDAEQQSSQTSVLKLEEEVNIREEDVVDQHSMKSIAQEIQEAGKEFSSNNAEFSGNRELVQEVETDRCDCDLDDSLVPFCFSNEQRDPCSSTPPAYLVRNEVYALTRDIHDPSSIYDNSDNKRLLYSERNERSDYWKRALDFEAEERMSTGYRKRALESEAGARTSNNYRKRALDFEAEERISTGYRKQALESEAEAKTSNDYRKNVLDSFDGAAPRVEIELFLKSRKQDNTDEPEGPHHQKIVKNFSEGALFCQTCPKCAMRSRINSLGEDFLLCTVCSKREGKLICPKPSRKSKGPVADVSPRKNPDLKRQNGNSIAIADFDEQAVKYAEPPFVIPSRYSTCKESTCCRHATNELYNTLIHNLLDIEEELMLTQALQTLNADVVELDSEEEVSDEGASVPFQPTAAELSVAFAAARNFSATEGEGEVALETFTPQDGEEFLKYEDSAPYPSSEAADPGPSLDVEQADFLSDLIGSFSAFTKKQPSLESEDKGYKIEPFENLDDYYTSSLYSSRTLLGTPSTNIGPKGELQYTEPPSYNFSNDDIPSSKYKFGFGKNEFGSSIGQHGSSKSEHDSSQIQSESSKKEYGSSKKEFGYNQNEYGSVTTKEESNSYIDGSIFLPSAKNYYSKENLFPYGSQYENYRYDWKRITPWREYMERVDVRPNLEAPMNRSPLLSKFVESSAQQLLDEATLILAKSQARRDKISNAAAIMPDLPSHTLREVATSTEKLLRDTRGLLKKEEQKPFHLFSSNKNSTTSLHSPVTGFQTLPANSRNTSTKGTKNEDCVQVVKAEFRPNHDIDFPYEYATANEESDKNNSYKPDRDLHNSTTFLLSKDDQDLKGILGGTSFSSDASSCPTFMEPKNLDIYSTVVGLLKKMMTSPRDKQRTTCSKDFKCSEWGCLHDASFSADHDTIWDKLTGVLTSFKTFHTMGKWETVYGDTPLFADVVPRAEMATSPQNDGAGIEIDNENTVTEFENTVTEFDNTVAEPVKSRFHCETDGKCCLRTNERMLSQPSTDDVISAVILADIRNEDVPLDHESNDFLDSPLNPRSTECVDHSLRHDLYSWGMSDLDLLRRRKTCLFPGISIPPELVSKNPVPLGIHPVEKRSEVRHLIPAAEYVNENHLRKQQLKSPPRVPTGTPRDGVGLLSPPRVPTGTPHDGLGLLSSKRAQETIKKPQESSKQMVQNPGSMYVAIFCKGKEIHVNNVGLPTEKAENSASPIDHSCNSITETDSYDAPALKTLAKLKDSCSANKDTDSGDAPALKILAKQSHGNDDFQFFGEPLTSSSSEDGDWFDEPSSIVSNAPVVEKQSSYIDALRSFFSGGIVNEIDSVYWSLKEEMDRFKPENDEGRGLLNKAVEFLPGDEKFPEKENVLGDYTSETIKLPFNVKGKFTSEQEINDVKALENNRPSTIGSPDATDEELEPAEKVGSISTKGSSIASDIAIEDIEIPEEKVFKNARPFTDDTYSPLKSDVEFKGSFGLPSPAADFQTRNSEEFLDKHKYSSGSSVSIFNAGEIPTENRQTRPDLDPSKDSKEQESSENPSSADVGEPLISVVGYHVWDFENHSNDDDFRCMEKVEPQASLGETTDWEFGRFECNASSSAGRGETQH